ncbi:MAG: arginine--tRNA ligase [Planctomyces sp.]|nr:arginine--tRNA ligase [Planctomyces sp.]
MNILAELQSRFAAALTDLAPDPQAYAAMVRPAQDARNGDYQANCAMPLARIVGAKPHDVAKTIIDRARLDDLCEPPTVAGPGFINLTLRREFLEHTLAAVAADRRFGAPAAESPKSIVVDFSSPNVAKPMHVGHLRSTVIGDALHRILEFAGHQVLSDNHVGDWGTQFGMILYGYKHFLDAEAYVADKVGELARLYRLVNQLCDCHDARESLPRLRAELEAATAKLPALEAAAGQDKAAQAALKKARAELDKQREELKTAERKVAAVEQDPAMRELADAHPGIARAARDETAKLHAGDPENRALWDEFLPACLGALQRLYDRLGIQFDHTLGESFYDPYLPEVVRQLASRGLAVESDGARCVFLEGRNAPFIVQKGDGAYTYATTDLATIEYRVKEFGAQIILYVVDARQSDHFEMLFETARRWGFADVECRHISFGMVLGEDGRPFKTRAGDTVGLESLLDEAIREARRIVDENDDSKRNEHDQPAPELDDAERAAVAEAVGLGGIKYADLRHNRESDYVFSWSKMLAKTGDTATYLQYAYARTRGILRKAEAAGAAAGTAPIAMAQPAERALALHICRFPEAVSAVAQEYRPNFLTQYLFELANSFSSFYDACPVMKEPDPAVRASRLRLVDLTGAVLKKGLSLLGIQACERM